jgi:mannosylglycoprotein endo-beta-mannosidase
VSSFFDNYERAYLHTTTELENRSSWTAECSLTVQVTMELEDGICLVEHLQTQNVSVPANSRVQYTFPEVSNNLQCAYSKVLSIVSINLQLLQGT